MRLLTVTIGVIALLAGCAQSPGGTGEPSTSAPDDSGETSAIDLVNLWRVTGAEGEEPETWLRLDAGELQLWRDCGMLVGSWLATDSLLIASLYGGMGECTTTEPPHVPWLESVTGYRAISGGWELTDANGAVIAELTIDGAPEPIPTAAEFFAEPPEITEATRELLRQPADLPSGLTPATSTDLEGRWTPQPPVAGANDEPHVVFSPDGGWTGTDGCNGNQGRWAASATGSFLATSGASTLMMCDGAPVPSWVSSARSVSIDAGVLTLFDIDGIELARLQRG